MRLVAAALVTMALAGCKADSSSGGAPPPAASAGPAALDAEPPVVASFIELDPDPGKPFVVMPCHEQILAVVRGSATVEGEQLATGDVLVVRVAPPILNATGNATVLAAAIREKDCDMKPYEHVVRAADAPELTFMHGAMHAHLDVDSTVSPTAYLGRLSGTAAVAEHTHPQTWEVLCTLAARGTFTLAGQSKRLGVRECVSVPPDVKHSWQPDEGNPLVALQMYWPPGPEQRFKKLAADEAAGGDH
jgi:mannose-6-phosphate isomerase-like protein (cupin superfamily)